MIVSIIVAASENGVIGNDNDLIWNLPNDMMFFKKTTLGHHVIMGRKNHESIPHKFSPLVGRTNIIISRNNEYKAKGCIIVNSIEKALTIAKKNKEEEAFIIGGGEIYKLALEKNIVDVIYLTEVHHFFEGDTFFKMDNNWSEISRIKHKKDSRHKYNFSFIKFVKKQ